MVNYIVLSRFELEDLVGNVSMLTNYEEDADLSAELNDLIEHLDVYL